MHRRLAEGLDGIKHPSEQRAHVHIIVHGALKNAFLGQLLHEWVGDEGSIRKFGCSYRGMDDAKTDINCRGVVTKKFAEGGENFVELDIWTENHDGKKTTPGTALVTLPSRN